MQFFATSPRGLEKVLADELTGLGASEVVKQVAGVAFSGELEVGYRACLWSRFASRMLLVLVDAPCDSADQLYQLARDVDWSMHLDPKRTFAIDCVGTNRWLRNTQFGAMKVKDAVVDHFVDESQQRPSVARQQPDLRLNLYISRDRMRLCVDLSGDSLHRRGYRQGTGAAPLKENLAAGLVALSGWQPDTPLFDPMCGSGTLLIEAALMAADQAPGLLRKQWGLEGWRGHRPAVWSALQNEAKARASLGLKRCKGRFWGVDSNRRVLAEAVRNAEAAGIGKLVHFEAGDATDLTRPCQDDGVLISNPPYGERLGEMPQLVQLYTMLGSRLRREMAGWKAAVFSGAPELLVQLRLRADERIKLFNGRIPSILANFTLAEPRAIDTDFSLPNGDQIRLSEGAKTFANRLRKNAKHLRRWAKREGLNCYRVYDADIPDYNVAIDCYDDFLVIQEYAPPATVPADKAQQRLLDALLIAPIELGIAPANVALKVRQQQKSSQQYQKHADRKQAMTVSEYNARFQVNLFDYLDTGLFLDHRLTRRRVGEMAAGKRFLNLFAYTGTATVHAALGGAKSTTTVDMSRTYLDWAIRNMELNDLGIRGHHFQQADCLQWLSQCDDQFDLIFCDPPTFSNSKRMKQSFDVQRDHLDLIRQLNRILSPGGTIVFSNNKRNFKLDREGVAKLGLVAEDWTAATLPEDFRRNPQIHNCWCLRQSGSAA